MQYHLDHVNISLIYVLQFRVFFINFTGYCQSYPFNSGTFVCDISLLILSSPFSFHFFGTSYSSDVEYLYSYSSLIFLII